MQYRNGVSDMSENVKVALYCRLSVEDKNKAKAGDDSESIQNQKLLLEEYAKSQGWQIYDIYSDDDYSGMDRDRPAFQKMINDARKKQFDIILCKNQSRFSRDMEVVEKYINHRFLLWGIRFIGVVDNVDTALKGNKKSRQIYALTNEWICEDTSENIRYVFNKKMHDGQFLGSFASYGYKKNPDDRHKLVIDEEAAYVIREIFRLYLQGYGCIQIANILTDRKILTPAAYKKQQGLKFTNPNSKKYSETYGVWAQNTVSRILANPVYIGHLIQGRERKVSYKSKKVIIAPKEEWITVKNTHEPIIDEDTFNKVQTLREARRTVHKPKDNNYNGLSHAHLLAGKVRCLDCGNNLIRSSKGRNGDVYLRCQLSAKTKQTACTYHTVKLESLIAVVESKIRDMLEKFMSEKGDLNFLEEYCIKSENITAQINTLQKEAKNLNTIIEEIGRTLTSAYVDKTKNVIVEAEFLTIKQNLNTDIENHKLRLAIINKDIDGLISQKSALKDMGKVLKEHTHFEKLTHEIANDFLDFIEVGEKKETGRQIIRIHWHF